MEESAGLGVLVQTSPFSLFYPPFYQCSFTVTKKIVLGCIRMYFLLKKRLPTQHPVNSTTCSTYYART